LRREYYLENFKDLLNFDKVFIYQNLLFKDSDKLSIYFKLGISVKFPINNISYKNKIRFYKKKIIINFTE